MKLVAIWVSNYMRIKNQGFNFGSRFTYSFNYIQKEKRLEISAAQTEDYYDLFAEGAVKNITGIVGRNGSGKTSLLKLLNVVEGEMPLSFPVVMVFENNSTKAIQVYNYSRVSLKNTISISLISDFLNYSNEKIKFEIVNASLFRFTDLLYYSNLVSDQNDQYLSMDNKLNRSVDYQMRISLRPEQVRKYFAEYDTKVAEKMMSAEESFNLYTLYENDRFKKFIKFLADVSSKHHSIRDIIKDIHFPKTLTVWMYEELLDECYQIANRLDEYSKIKSIISKCIEFITHESNPILKFKNDLILKSFCFLFKNEFLSKEKKSSADKIMHFINSRDLGPSIFNDLRDVITGSNLFTGILAKHTAKVLTNLEAKLSKAGNILASPWPSLGAYEFPVNTELYDLIKELLELVDLEGNRLFRYSWASLSAGETAFINQFSEYYDALPHINKQYLLITIDEGELFFHPEWQRKYIYNLFLFFDYFIKEKVINVECQFILTSHSAFMTGDIPKFNLVFLDKAKNGLCKVIDSVLKKETFGGNIFELYNDSFFVKEFISEFAFQKIDDAFKFLHNKQSTFKSLQEVEFFSRLIGEPIIRNELERLINRKKDPDFDKYYTIVSEDSLKIKDKKKKENKKNGE